LSSLYKTLWWATEKTPPPADGCIVFYKVASYNKKVDDQFFPELLVILMPL
jgi:hypothetical protein